MWRVVRAEISHGKERIIGYASLYCLFLSITWLWVRWERNQITATLLFLFVMALSAAYGGEKWRILRKRDRMHTLLPLSLRQVGFSRLMFPIVLWLGFIFLFFAAYAFFLPFSKKPVPLPSFNQMLAVAGLILIVSAMSLLFRDLRVTYTRMHRRLFLHLAWWFVYIGALLPFYIVMNFLGWFGENTTLQRLLMRLGDLPYILIAPGLVLSVISLRVFTRRKSFVES